MDRNRFALGDLVQRWSVSHRVRVGNDTTLNSVSHIGPAEHGSDRSANPVAGEVAALGPPYRLVLRAASTGLAMTTRFVNAIITALH